MNTASTTATRATQNVGPVNDQAIALRKMPKTNEKVLVDSLLSAISFHRDALELEMAVSLLFFGAKGETNSVSLKTKKALREIYQRAGYDCVEVSGEDYKTVNRRINVSADFFVFVGGSETLIDWLEDATPSKQINKIVEELKGYNFSGVSAVQAYIGKTPGTVRGPNKAKEEKTAEQKEAESVRDEVAQMLNQTVAIRREAESKGIPEGRIITSGPLTLAIPFEASYDDVMGMARNLMHFANQQMQLPVEQKVPATAH